MSSPPTTGDTLHNGTSWAWASVIIVVVILQSAMGADYMIMAQVGFFVLIKDIILSEKEK